MPRYEYECPNGHKQETSKSILDYDEPEICHHPFTDGVGDECGTFMKHVFTGQGVVFVNNGGGAGTRVW